MAKLAWQEGSEGREYLYEGGTTTGSISSGTGGKPTTVVQENNRLLFYTLVGLSIYYLGV